MRIKGLSSSTGTKLVIAVTGLALFAYLIVHLVGNLLVFLGPETFNNYSHVLVSNPLIYPLEIGLAAIAGLHIWKAVTNYRANRNARPVAYHKQEWAGEKSRRSAASWTMIITGSLTLLFIILHLVTLKFGTFHEYHAPAHAGVPAAAPAGGHAVRDLYRTEVELFKQPGWVLFYVAGMVVIGFHLWHGFWSAFQSLGAANQKALPGLMQTGKVLTIVIVGGFIFVTLYVAFVLSPQYVPGGTP